MKVLILEDDERRIAQFKEKLEGHELYVTKDPKEANEWLETEGFDFIFLDHDLAPEHYNDDTVCNETTGLCTAEFLGDNKWLSSDAHIVVHSLNPAGAIRMMRALYGRQCTRLPFDSLIVNLKG